MQKVKNSWLLTLIMTSSNTRCYGPHQKKSRFHSLTEINKCVYQPGQTFRLIYTFVSLSSESIIAKITNFISLACLFSWLSPSSWQNVRLVFLQLGSILYMNIHGYVSIRVKAILDLTSCCWQIYSIYYIINAFIEFYMGFDARKPVFRVSDKVRFKPVSSATETSLKIEIAPIICVHCFDRWL